jgi:gamma-glutamyltranspeptidase/glutathione hydrolase
MTFTTRPELRGTFGMVTSTHWLASAAGMSVLEQGGNAFDAGVAAGLTLQVVEPHLNGPGGDLPALVWPAGRNEPIVLCAQGPAPRAASIAHYRDQLGLRLVPGTGPLAAVVPGAFGGWLALLRDFGTLRLRDVLRFAIGYAEDGHPQLAQTAQAIRRVEELFTNDWTTSAETYLPVVEAGGRARNPALAATYRRLLEEAERAAGREEQIEAAHDIWYRGWIAEAFTRFSERSWLDSSGERHSGLLAEQDLRDWRPRFERPLAIDYHGYTVFKAGPWSQAPVFLQQLRLLEGIDLAELGLGSAEYVHAVTESAKLAFADREAWYGDPDFVDVPMEALLSRDYANERRMLVGRDSASGLRPGSPDGRVPRLASVDDAGERAAAAGVGEPTRAAVKGDTVHLDVVDRDGNMISATPSGGWLYGAPVIPELGFCLGTRAQMFWLEEGLPNSLAPRKRPRTTLSPTLVGADGEPYMGCGTPGGDQQDQWTLHALLAHIHFGLDLQQAIDAPNHHTEAFPSSFYPRETKDRHVALERRAGEEALEGLRARGHEVEPAAPWSLGRVTAVARGHDGVLRAAADPRSGQAYAAGR